MTHKKSRSDEDFPGLRELDHIVSQVIGAIRESPRTERRKSARDHDDNVIYDDRWQRAPDESPDGEDELPDFSELPDGVPPEQQVDERACEHDIDELPPLDWEDTAAAAVEDDRPGPLSEAEIAFVERTVRWLERRPNRDVIMDQMWRRLLPIDDTVPSEPGASAAPPDESPSADGADEAPMPPE